MGRQLHSISAKAFPERKKPTKRQAEWLLGATTTAFSVYLSVASKIAYAYYSKMSLLAEEIEWSHERKETDGTVVVELIADVYTHPKNAAFDHWLELFITALTSDSKDISQARSRFTDKQFEILATQVYSTQVSYPALLTQTTQYYQYIILERGLYLLDKSDSAIIPLEPGIGQPNHHFQPEDHPHDLPIPLEFFKPSEQARINAYLQSDYCLCPVCQVERTRLGLI